MKTKFSIFNFQLILTIVVLAFLYSCSSDKRPEIAKQYFEQKVIEESRGAIKLVDFKKMNGIDREVMGQKIYEMEFSADIELMQEGWKTGNGLEGYWNNFSLLDQSPQFWDNFVSGGNAKHFVRGQRLQFTGKINFENTENGWRVSDRFELKTATDQGINDDYVKDKKSNRIADKNFELTKIIGSWKTLTGDKEIVFYDNGNGIEFSGTGYYFSGRNHPNMEPNTKTYIEKNKDGNYLAWHKTPNGAGAGYVIEYYPDKDHISVNKIEFERK